MLDNMRWAQARAQPVADEIAEAERETGKTADPALYKLMLGLRGMAQQCAEGAAPYLHPRLAAVANLDPPNEDGPKTPEELLALVLAKIDGQHAWSRSRSRCYERARAPAIWLGASQPRSIANQPYIR